MAGYAYPSYAYRRCADHDAPGRHKIVIVGAGLVGLTAAIDLGLRGLPVVVIDEDNTVSLGSRSICQAKRTLEVWDRLGCAAPMMAKGITWQKGKIFFRDVPKQQPIEAWNEAWTEFNKMYLMWGSVPPAYSSRAGGRSSS